MRKQDYLIIVALYLRGVDLDPASVSIKLGISPTHAQRSGESMVTSTNHKYVTQIGVWGLESDLKTRNISDHINQLMSKLENISSLQDIENVQESYVDIEDEVSCEFELSEKNICDLKKHNLPVRFTISFGRA